MYREREKMLVEQCQLGNRQALGDLITDYQRPVYNAMYRILGDTSSAADVTQTAFLKALENIQQYNENFKFFSWLYRIAVNEAIDTIKRSRHFVPLQDDPLEAPGHASDGAEHDESARHLQVALMALSEDLRTVIALRYFSDCGYQEIGAILDLPEKTVKSRLFTARQRLREQLQQRGVFSS
jgi:RNA polymerase sigma-70 factor (ECF subfamily)